MGACTRTLAARATMSPPSTLLPADASVASSSRSGRRARDAARRGAVRGPSRTPRSTIRASSSSRLRSRALVAPRRVPSWRRATGSSRCPKWSSPATSRASRQARGGLGHLRHAGPREVERRWRCVEVEPRCGSSRIALHLAEVPATVVVNPQRITGFDVSAGGVPHEPAESTGDRGRGRCRDWRSRGRCRTVWGARQRVIQGEAAAGTKNALSPCGPTWSARGAPSARSASRTRSPSEPASERETHVGTRTWTCSFARPSFGVSRGASSRLLARRGDRQDRSLDVPDTWLRISDSGADWSTNVATYLG